MKPHPLGPPLQKIWRGGRNRAEGKINVNRRNLRETESFEHLDFENLNLFRISIFEFRICKLTQVIISAQAGISDTLKMRKHRLQMKLKNNAFAFFSNKIVENGLFNF